MKNCEPRIKDEFIKNEIKQFMGVIEEMCRSDTDLGIIKDNVFSSEKAKNSALQILRFKDEILEEFRNDFLLNRIDYGDKFKLVFITDNDEKEEYKHLIAKVKSTINEKTVAYICYETNLYMYVPNPDNRVTETNWKVADDEKYGWTYLEFIKNKHINFNKLWENTDPKFWDNTRKIVIANYIK